MKSVKITKRMLKLHPLDLLIKLNAVSSNNKYAYPQNVYISSEDYKELKNNLKKYAKKNSPHSPEKLINYSVGVDLLNYGPNETLSKVIRPGWALIDVDQILKNKQYE